MCRCVRVCMQVYKNRVSMCYICIIEIIITCNVTA